MDLKKKNRYANSNLHEVFNYEEKLAKHLEEKREKKKTVSIAPIPNTVTKKISIA